jgi:hypothetical protein
VHVVLALLVDVSRDVSRVTTLLLPVRGFAGHFEVN